MARRRRVDWDEEIRKTDKIRNRGLLMSVLSFAVACAFIFGMSRISETEIELPRKVLSVLFLCAAFIVLVSLLKRRAKKRERK